MSTLKITISGVRGVFGESLTPEICLDFAKAFGTYLNGAKVVVASDPRKSSDIIREKIFLGLTSCGCEVVDIGIAPTPTLAIMVRELKASGGIMITASHNPLPWNGIKFVKEDGIFLNQDQAKKLIDLYQTKNFISNEKGKVSAYPNAGVDHIKKVFKALNSKLSKKYRVVIDACNGAGSIIIPKILKEMGCEVIEMNTDTKKPFAHNPEPVAENIQELCKTVKDKKADIGFALDSDADRLAIVSDAGVAIGEEMTQVLAADYLLQNPGNWEKIVVTNLSSSRAVEDIAKSHNARVVRTKIGEVHVAEKTKELKAVLGGEGNGGVIFPPVTYNRDTLSGVAIILNLLDQRKIKLSEILKEFPYYEIVKSKIQCSNNKEIEALQSRIKAAFAQNELDLTDGVKIIFEKAWVHVRASNTEPIIRIIAEAQTKEEAQKLIEKVKGL